MGRYLLNDRAFSLIELALILSVVIVILMAGLPMATEVLEQTRQAKSRNDLKAIAQASGEYYRRYGSWPSQPTDLQPYFLSSKISFQGILLKAQSHLLEVTNGSDSVDILKPR